jgi:ferric-dicitrate binding protein FerR (iron transport regulator)
MEDQYFDKIFNDKINQMDMLPLGVKWTPDKGWRTLIKRQHKYKMFAAYAGLGIAALVMLLIGIKLLLNDTPGSKTFITGSKKKELLIDNSSVWLNRNTKLHYPVSLATNSLLWLEGEALFDFSTHSNQPITVRTKNILIFSTGSIFNVKLDTTTNAITITPVAGKLKITNPVIPDFPTVEIVPGRIAYITPTDEVVIVDNDDPNFLAWKTGLLEFKSAPLRYVAKKLEDTYGIKISVNSSIEFCTVSMECRNQPLRSILNNLQKQMNLQVDQEGKDILMSGKNCSIDNPKIKT